MALRLVPSEKVVASQVDLFTFKGTGGASFTGRGRTARKDESEIAQDRVT